MNCYFHEDRVAVAQCSNCGRYLCKECASKHIPAICEECYALYKENEKKRRIPEKVLFVIVSIYILIGITFAFSSVMLGHYTLAKGAEGLLDYILVGCIPYGWEKLSVLRDKLGFILILPLFGWIAYFILKLGGAYFIGWFFYLLKAKQYFVDKDWWS